MVPERFVLIVATLLVAGELTAGACPEQPCSTAFAAATQATQTAAIRVEAGGVPALRIPAARIDAPLPQPPGLWVGLKETREPALEDGEIERPPFWAILREVHAKLPRVEGAPKREGFTAIFSPVIVSGPNDTVPGVGVGGDF